MHNHHHKNMQMANSGKTKPGIASQTAIASCETSHHGQVYSQDDIRLCAYRKWENAGKPAGDGIQFWLDAEHELVQSHNQ